jgi:hypothetical protein
MAGPLTTAVAPKTKKFGGIKFTLSSMNPTFISNCTSKRATEDAAVMRHAGWLVRIARIRHDGKYAYVTYERRSREQATKLRKQLTIAGRFTKGTRVTQRSLR